MHRTKIVVTDLDGTLLRSDNSFNIKDLEMLNTLNSHKILRVIATGRSLYSTNNILSQDFPIDYLIFSSGAGIYNWQEKKIESKFDFTKKQALFIYCYLLKHKYDFCIQDIIPKNHSFHYLLNNEKNKDFITRVNHYNNFAKAIDINSYVPYRSSQFIVIVEPHIKPEKLFNKIERDLSQFKVIRATSPLDNQSTWIEIFPRSVSKGIAANYLINKMHISPSQTLAVGNDYNDLDLLKWSSFPFVVKNAPDDIQKLYPVVNSNNNCGFSDAILQVNKF